MVFDLSKAMRRKEEFESARLMDFEFRLRARTAKLMAHHLELDAADLVGRIVDRDHARFMMEVAEETAKPPAELQRLWTHLESQARQSLVAERGDPAPYRMA